MKLRYINEHLICRNYEKGDNAVFERMLFKQGTAVKKELVEAEIYFILSGEFEMTFQNTTRISREGEILLFPPVQQFTIFPLSDVRLIVFRIKGPIHLCEVKSLESLLAETPPRGNENCYLTANERLNQFLDLLYHSLEDGLYCKCLAELKSKEIFYYFRAYYVKEELSDFFAPLFTKDYQFTVYVLQNYKEMKTVQQFAESYGYSLSKFEREFKKIFQTPVYQWMMQKKSNLIYNELVYTSRTLMDISDEFDFSSLTQFNDFCKRFLGMTPARIRNTRKCLNNFTRTMNK